MSSNRERGQSTVEWIGLLLLVSTALALLASLAGLGLSGIALANAIKSKFLCAVALSDDCRAGESALVAAYGTELAAEVAERAPQLVYERGMRALPVDYRSCREDPCSLGQEEGEVTSSFEGEPVTLFVHAVERADSAYLQYWAYYPGSATQIYGDAGQHPDDWESFQLRIDAAGAEARASSHQGYNYGGGPGNWLSDAGFTHRSDVWGPDRGAYFISGGSHAGHASDDGEPYRWTPSEAVRLVPLEPIAESDPDVSFAVTPPWLKRVWRDPEYGGTD